MKTQEMDKSKALILLECLYHDSLLLRETLDPLSQAIRKASQRIKHNEETKPPEVVDVMNDEDYALIESLLGAAFVVCQACINSMASRAEDANKCLPKGIPIPKDGNGRSLPFNLAIKLYGSDNIKGTKITEVQAIHALANYFKHYDGWPSDWTQAKNKQQKSTIDVLKYLGITSWGTGNLRTGAEKLGNPNYYDLERFTEAIEKWAENIKQSFAETMGVSRGCPYCC